MLTKYSRFHPLPAMLSSFEFEGQKFISHRHTRTHAD